MGNGGYGWTIVCSALSGVFAGWDAASASVVPWPIPVKYLAYQGRRQHSAESNW